ncbi:MAG: pyrroline-5-carboxylate reductase [Desulfovibrionaceae bacterium]|nr:pyrroline-5-carboxylate reductase [Desulfovibrionaceae bacterium]
MQENRLRVGCIGCGNMGGALLAGWARTGRYDLYGHTRTMSRMAPLIELGVQPREEANALAGDCDIIVLAVKPYQIEAVVGALDRELLKGRVLVSLAAGISLATVSRACGGACPVARCMPNTPAMVGEGVFALCYEDSVTAAQKEALDALFSSLGVSLEIPEKSFTAFSALIGAGPAYVFELMEGMVMAGVTLGFQHRDSRRMVEALFRGCARMAQENPQTHLIALRDNVCSPAGLTIAGVNRMAADGLSGKLAEAVFAADRRGREMEG